MKICHVITRLILGGAQENTLLSCEGLHARGHDVTLVTGPALGPEGQLIGRAHAGGYRVIELPPLRREIHPLRDWQSYRQIRRTLKELRPEVMHSHSSKAGILARRAAAALGGMKIVHTIHGLPFHPYQPAWLNRMYVTLERRAARQSDALVSVADAMTAQALAAGVGEAGQYETIYSGMEVEPFLNRPAGAEAFRQSLGLGPDAVLVTQVSRLAELKGHEYLIEAAQGLGERIHFCFVGDGRLAGELREWIGRQGLGGRFHLTGLLPPERIPEVLHASDILAHCSLREGLARALPQAMLCGLPVVSFDVDGAREVVDEKTGVLIPPREVGALRDALQRLADDPPLRRQLGQAGRELCRLRFDQRVMVERLETLYRRLGA